MMTNLSFLDHHTTISQTHATYYYHSKQLKNIP